MNILIITTYFIPDSAIAAVRPYMFAKHLTEMGDNVTVLRSGEFELPPFDEYDKNMDFEVISALGKNSDAEKFMRGEYEGFTPVPKGKYHFIPKKIKMPLKFIRDVKNVSLKKPPKCLEHLVTVLKYQKQVINDMHSKGRKFDVVFSTCGTLENIYAGRYAARKFNAAWIMDFRDPMIMTRNLLPDYIWNIYAKRATVCALKEADCITAVSRELCNELKALHLRSDIYLVHNGYDENEEIPEVDVPKGELSFCYTGRIYEDRKPALRALARCIASLIECNKVDRKKIRFYYAGSNLEDFSEVFASEGISDILIDKGYLSKGDTFKMQLECDVFTVMSWNTTESKGILTGKFYEGIKAGKPILALISGNEPNSELLHIQKKFGYGYCYEICNSEMPESDLANYIESLYNEKMSCGKLSYTPSEELRDAFCYGSISKKLKSVIIKAEKISKRKNETLT